MRYPSTKPAWPTIPSSQRNPTSLWGVDGRHALPLPLLPRRSLSSPPRRTACYASPSPKPNPNPNHRKYPVSTSACGWFVPHFPIPATRTGRLSFLHPPSPDPRPQASPADSSLLGIPPDISTKPKAACSRRELPSATRSRRAPWPPFTHTHTGRAKHHSTTARQRKVETSHLCDSSPHAPSTSTSPRGSGRRHPRRFVLPSALLRLSAFAARAGDSPRRASSFRHATDSDAPDDALDLVTAAPRQPPPPTTRNRPDARQDQRGSARRSRRRPLPLGDPAPPTSTPFRAPGWLAGGEGEGKGGEDKTGDSTGRNGAGIFSRCHPSSLGESGGSS